MGKYARTTPQGYIIVREKPNNYLVTHPDKVGTVHVWGNGHSSEVYYHVTEGDFDYRDDDFEAVDYRGCTYDVGELLYAGSWGGSDPPDWMSVFGNCYMNDSFFSGVIIRLEDNGYDATCWTFYLLDILFIKEI